MAVLELALWIFGWGEMMVFNRSDAWGYLMTPLQSVKSYGHPVEINSMGLRGPEVSARKSEGVWRIVYLGDSITYGGGRIEENELFCRVSESLLRRDGIRTETVNVSAPGWSPQNWGRYVETNGLMEADLAVIVLPECDLDRPFGTMEHYGFRETKPVLRLVAVGLKLEAMLAGTRPSSDLVGSHHTPEENVRANVEAVLKVQELGRSRGIDVFVVFVPSYPLTAAAEYWPRFESVTGQETVDLRSELTEERLFMDGAHLSVEGHAIVGRRLYERIAHVLSSRSERTNTEE